MSGTEVEIFEKFGFEYFQYISKCYVEQVTRQWVKLGTCVKKMYRIIIDKLEMGKTRNMCMENVPELS
jgi:hypothetical protein